MRKGLLVTHQPLVFSIQALRLSFSSDHPSSLVFVESSTKSFSRFFVLVTLLRVICQIWYRGCRFLFSQGPTKSCNPRIQNIIRPLVAFSRPIHLPTTLVAASSSFLSLLRCLSSRINATLLLSSPLVLSFLFLRPAEVLLLLASNFLCSFHATCFFLSLIIVTRSHSTLEILFHSLCGFAGSIALESPGFLLTQASVFAILLTTILNFSSLSLIS